MGFESRSSSRTATSPPQAITCAKVSPFTDPTALVDSAPYRMSTRTLPRFPLHAATNKGVRPSTASCSSRCLFGKDLSFTDRFLAVSHSSSTSRSTPSSCGPRPYLAARHNGVRPSLSLGPPSHPCPNERLGRLRGILYARASSVGGNVDRRLLALPLHDAVDSSHRVQQRARKQDTLKEIERRRIGVFDCRIQQWHSGCSVTPLGDRFVALWYFHRIKQGFHDGCALQPGKYSGSERSFPRK
ncbi:hypothetical protein DFJ73DRAFT_509683 [Zopfochytrium polystomum]|nr:hypothetical protein DFJ73DRAFT_509683 [Zopfochytrium polystomum]